MTGKKWPVCPQCESDNTELNSPTWSTDAGWDKRTQVDELYVEFIATCTDCNKEFQVRGEISVTEVKQ